jgi:phage terminase large subunit-like protein
MSELTPDQIEKRDLERERNRKYKQAQRKREKDAKAAEVQADDVLEFLRQMQGRDRDAQGARYKSEARSYFELGVYYSGLKASEIARLTDALETGVQTPTLDRSNIRPNETPILGLPRTFEQWLELRDKARKDLFFLGSSVLNIKFLREEVHRIVFDQFVQKNFDGAFHEGFTSDDVIAAMWLQKRYASITDNNVVTDSIEETRQMMLLDPRAFGKSTANRVDVISWMINVPDIRILILTGRRKLGQSFLQNIKTFLFLGELGKPTTFHLLFPEYVHHSDLGTAQMFVSPARILNITDATVEADGIESNLSGAHYDVLKGDDVVTDENSNTEATRENLRMKYDGVILNLPDEWGFVDIIGTRYWVDDFYGTRLNPGLDEDGNSLSTPIKYFRRQAWFRKPEFPESAFPLRKLEEHMVTLPFPTKASFKVLRYKLRQNERSFRNQQLNEPTDAQDESPFTISFDIDMLRRNSIQPVAAPQVGQTFNVWDLATSANKDSDWSVGATLRLFQVNPGLFGVTVMDVSYGKWRHSELAVKIVELNNKWKPTATVIENAAGAESLKDKIRVEALKRGGYHPNIRWIPPSSTKNAKRNRIKGLETLLIEGRLKLVIGHWTDELQEQFVKFTGDKANRGRKDDIPDAIAIGVEQFLPRASKPGFSREERERIEEEETQKRLLVLQYGAIHGSSTPKSPQGVVPFPSGAPQRPTNSKSDLYRSALRKVFGQGPKEYKG